VIGSAKELLLKFGELRTNIAILLVPLIDSGITSPIAISETANSVILLVVSHWGSWLSLLKFLKFFARLAIGSVVICLLRNPASTLWIDLWCIGGRLLRYSLLRCRIDLRGWVR
jgi:hypothetical protein